MIRSHYLGSRDGSALASSFPQSARLPAVQLLVTLPHRELVGAHRLAWHDLLQERVHCKERVLVCRRLAIELEPSQLIVE